MSSAVPNSFCRIELRTTEVESARTFYTTLFGHDRATIWPLHEQARARGAVPHWLGHVDVGDPQRLTGTLRDFIARGAVQLGPVMATDDRGHFVVIRDPGGAILSLNAPLNRPMDAAPAAAWSVLNTNNALIARTNYHELLGWDVVDAATASVHGPFYDFSFTRGSPPAGAIVDIVGRPGIHPHWLHFFNVASVDEAMAVTRRAGGTAFDAGLVSSGKRLAVCEDPHGAAFGVIEG